jgi:type IV pilus assembly protein PilX
MKHGCLKRRPRGSFQRGVTMLVVLVLLSVMLLGGLALARITEIGTLASGNAAFREASLQASEVGLNTAYMAVRGISGAAEETNVAGWYWSTIQATDAQGLPTMDFDAAPEVVVGSYSVRYVVERLCNTTPVTNTLQQCLVKQVPQTESSVAGRESIDPPNSRQFRVTVRVTGPKDTQAWIQSLVTKG